MIDLIDYKRYFRLMVRQFKEIARRVQKRTFRSEWNFARASISFGLIFLSIAHAVGSSEETASYPKVGQSNLDIAECEHIKTLPVHIPNDLSQSQRKKWFFAQDPFFRIGFYELQKHHPKVKDFCCNYTYLIVKTDGIAARCIDNVITYLQKNHFAILHADLVFFDEPKSTIFWQYQSNYFHVGWFRLISMVLENQPSVIMLLKDESPDKTQSASKRLNALKGHSITSLREPFQLRAQLGAKTGLLTFVHAPSDALSMIREWGIIMNSAQRKNWILSAKNYPMSCEKIEKIKSAVYSRIPYHSLDEAEAIEKLYAISETLPQNIKEELIAIINDDKRNFEALLALMEKYPIDIPFWDLVTFLGSRCGQPLPIETILD